MFLLNLKTKYTQRLVVKKLCLNLPMLNKDEEAFYLDWEQQRTKPHYKRKPFLRGLSVGLSLGVLVLIISELGWYERANMIANSRSNNLWIILAILIISIGFAWLYQQFTAEMNEQRYQELKHLKNKK
jgi:putative copper export protein